MTAIIYFKIWTPYFNLTSLNEAFTSPGEHVQPVTSAKDLHILLHDIV